MSDPNTDAARIVQQTAETSESDPMPPDLEQAWWDWSKRVQKLDARNWALLKAAFEAGAAAATAMHGRAGGLVGGKARAAALSKRKRTEIAKAAAAARWKSAEKKTQP